MVDTEMDAIWMSDRLSAWILEWKAGYLSFGVMRPNKAILRGLERCNLHEKLQNNGPLNGPRRFGK